MTFHPKPAASAVGQIPRQRSARMKHSLPTRNSLFASFLAAFALALVAQVGQAQDEAHFPTSRALLEGVSPEALSGLGELVQGFVDNDEIVGAELLVIKNGKTISHEGYGWRDRESEIAMETDSVFCVRSMTKPLIGTSILMLIDDDQLEFDDKASQFLPSFDVDGLREITIEQLLSHTSGLPLSEIMSANLNALHEQGGIRAVADLADAKEILFEPGTALQYSDQGTDTLTAIIEIVTGATAADFVRTRILEPLEMKSTTCVMSEDHPLRARGCSKYAGSSGGWTRFWSTDKPPIFPFFLGSQGLYSTLSDYARFMELWARKGRATKGRLLGSRYARKALTPGPFPLGGTTGFADLQNDYGYLMQLWTAEGEAKKNGEAGERDVIAFGHSGSDGTYAWVFPKEKAMAFYFTQTRGNNTGQRVEEALGRLFLGADYDSNLAAPPSDEYLGYYSEDKDNRYQAIIKDGEYLALETPGKRIRQLVFIGEDTWKFRAKPSVVLIFERSEEGQVTGFDLAGHREFRFEPSSDLPSVDEVVARVTETHGFDLLETMGPLRTHGSIWIEKLEISGTAETLYAWPNLFRADSEARGNFEQSAFDGESVWYSSTNQPVILAKGDRAEVIRAQNNFALFGDWREWYPTIEVIQRLQVNERDILVLRVGDTSAPAATYYVDLKTDRLIHVDSVSFLEGMGRVGQQASYSDFRDVGGMLLPFKTETQVASGLIGTVEYKVAEFELGVEVLEGTFELKD
ncbi:MAG: CubicO group peptidase (beta-lactamase class C family) [Planctomycetota bacterium]|jgi:CubicO group peptidase (beta-lactamase class C family)